MAGAAFYIFMGRRLPAPIKGLHVVTGGAEIRVRGELDRAYHKNEEKACCGKENDSPFLFFIHFFKLQLDILKLSRRSP